VTVVPVHYSGFCFFECQSYTSFFFLCAFVLPPCSSLGDLEATFWTAVLIHLHLDLFFLQLAVSGSSGVPPPPGSSSLLESSHPVFEGSGFKPPLTSTVDVRVKTYFSFLLVCTVNPLHTV